MERILAIPPTFGKRYYSNSLTFFDVDCPALRCVGAHIYTLAGDLALTLCGTGFEKDFHCLLLHWNPTVGFAFLQVAKGFGLFLFLLVETLLFHVIPLLIEVFVQEFQNESFLVNRKIAGTITEQALFYSVREVYNLANALHSRIDEIFDVQPLNIG